MWTYEQFGTDSSSATGANTQDQTNDFLGVNHDVYKSTISLAGGLSHFTVGHTGTQSAPDNYGTAQSDASYIGNAGPGGIGAGSASGSSAYHYSATDSGATATFSYSATWSQDISGGLTSASTSQYGSTSRVGSPTDTVTFSDITTYATTDTYSPPLSQTRTYNYTTASSVASTSWQSTTVTITDVPFSTTSTVSESLTVTTTVTESFSLYIPTGTLIGTVVSTTAVTTAETRTISTTSTGISGNITYYLTSTCSSAAVMLTIAEADFTDWAWIVTETSSGRIDQIGNSFTKTTIAGQIVTAQTTIISTFDTDSHSYTSYSYDTTTANFTHTSTSSSSYTTQGPTTQTTSGMSSDGPYTSTFVRTEMPPTSTGVGAISYTVTTAETVTFNTTGTDSNAVYNDSVLSTNTDTLTSYNSVYGTFTTALTYTIYSTTPLHQHAGTSTGLGYTLSFATAGTLFIGYGEPAGLVAPYSFIVGSATSADIPSFLEIALGNGFQAATQLGFGYPIGSGLGGGSAGADSYASLHPAGIIVPVFDFATHAVTVAGTPMTTQYVASANAIFTTTGTGTATATGSFGVSATGPIPSTYSSDNTATYLTFGGYGFNSTAGSTLTQTLGIHRYTSVDSTLGATTGYVTWDDTQTLVIPPGNQLVLEIAPKINTSTAAFIPFGGPIDTAYLSFSAFPGA